MWFFCNNKYHHWIISNFKRTDIYLKKNNFFNLNFLYTCYALNSGFDDGFWWVLYFIENGNYYLAKYIFVKLNDKGLNNELLIIFLNSMRKYVNDLFCKINLL